MKSKAPAATNNDSTVYLNFIQCKSKIVSENILKVAYKPINTYNTSSTNQNFIINSKSIQGDQIKISDFK